MFKTFYNLRPLLVVFLAALILAACASEPEVKKLSSTTDPQVEIEKLEESIQQAGVDQVGILSPQKLKSAQEAKDKAIKGRAKNKDQEYILHQIALSQAYLEQALTTADVSRQVLREPLAAREEALQAMANKYFGKEMEDLDSELVDLGEEIEGNSTAKAEKKRDKLAGQYRELEFKSIQKKALGVAHNNIQAAIKEGAKEFVPDTLGKTQTRYREIEAMIQKDPHNTSEVDNASNEITMDSERLLKLVRLAKKSTAMNPEQYAKSMEDRELAEVKLESSQKQLANVASENASLSSKVWLDEKYELAQKEFASNEAEVFKQGDKILLRLKGLSFPTNNATIPTEDFSLLAKVQKVIGEVSPHQISIEGHTDSTGDKKRNKKLSMERALAVQKYLVANNTADKDNISASGWGDAKPIASNKNQKGRAQNRRVDVIITADSLKQ